MAQTPQVGDKVDVIIIAEATIVDITTGHGKAYKLKFPQNDYQAAAERTVWLDDEKELKKIIIVK